MAIDSERINLIQDESPTRATVPEMFDRISRRYDLLNHLLSFGCDFYWRRQAVRELRDDRGQLVLDLACGTGDLALAAMKRPPGGRVVLGVDRAGGMLALACRKVEKRRLGNRIGLVRADGQALPLADASVDAAMIAFGIRNMPDTLKCLRELFRVIKSNGQLVVLEFSLPSNGPIRFIYLLYFRHLLPRLGGLISGDRQAYRYLDRTVETYLYGSEFVQRLESVGFGDVGQRALTCGVVTIYTGVRP